MDLDLSYKIVCEKGMTLTIESPIWLLDEVLDNNDDVFIHLSKNKKYVYAIIRPFDEMPASEIRDIIESLIKRLEEELEKGELNDGSV